MNCQPRSEPSTEFLKIRFGFSSSSAARITLDLVKCQFISFFRGFNFNAELIFAEIGITEEQSEVEQEKIQRETEVENYKIGACYNKSSRVENYDGNKRKARKVKRGWDKSSSDGDADLEKKRRQSSPGNTGQLRKNSKVRLDDSKTRNHNEENWSNVSSSVSTGEEQEIVSGTDNSNKVPEATFKEIRSKIIQVLIETQSQKMETMVS